MFSFEWMSLAVCSVDHSIVSFIVPVHGFLCFRDFLSGFPRGEAHNWVSSGFGAGLPTRRLLSISFMSNSTFMCFYKEI